MIQSARYKRLTAGLSAAIFYPSAAVGRNTSGVQRMNEPVSLPLRTSTTELTRHARGLSSPLPSLLRATVNARVHSFHPHRDFRCSASKNWNAARNRYASLPPVDCNRFPADWSKEKRRKYVLATPRVDTPCTLIHFIPRCLVKAFLHLISLSKRTSCFQHRADVAACGMRP